ncbi:uncharacterized protein LOC115700175 [Cannabis sativa]|uniref:uncharacterized protein LOC115700175 n=1 Tax=Cannabis sativa TaxID=3483 RepID=UPI0029CA1D7A|nr:uncharacterized protein LOC115700175 [Cannabis sativa]
MGFLEHWIRLIMSCVSLEKYKIIHGSHEVGPILPTQEIRQGDPLSPYLFIICAKKLSALLQKYERSGLIHGCKVANGAPQLSHILFVDDSYLYCKAMIQEAICIQELLRKFEMASGNIEMVLRNQLCSLLEITVVEEGSFYLGLPSTLSQNKTMILGYLRDKVRNRLKTWEGRFLFKGGKEVLIKSVVQAFPSYAMNVFLLPMEISRDIEQYITKFWWHSFKDGNKGINWMAWERLCKHKKGGGMGFHNF